MDGDRTLPRPPSQAVWHTMCLGRGMVRTFSVLALGLIATLGSLPTATSTAPTDLLGKPFAAALARLGPPDRGSGLGGCVTWSWRDDQGGLLRLCVHDDHVVHVDTAHGKAALTAKPVPATGYYPGQPVAELLERLGNPQRAGSAVATVGPEGIGRVPGPGAQMPAVPIADCLLVFADVRLHVSGGRVLGPEPAPSPAQGPR